MGTRFRIVLYAPDVETANRAAKAAFNRVARLDNTMSDYRETSELMTLCQRAGGAPVEVSDDLFRVLAFSQKIAAQTGGAFDVTMGPVVRLWRRARRTQVMPDPRRLAEARGLTGFAKLHLDPRKRTARLEKSGMLIDLGGVAKGYAADEAIKVLQQHGVTRALVAAGGDVVVSDAPPDAAGWTIGVAPRGASGRTPGQAPANFLLLKHAAVSTAGDAEQYVEIGGVRYSHIVDPRTGLGLTGRSSVTVVAPDGITSDSIDTAVNVLGPKRGLKLVDSTKGTAALILQSTESGVKSFESKGWGRVPTTSSKADNRSLHPAQLLSTAAREEHDHRATGGSLWSAAAEAPLSPDFATDNLAVRE